MLDFSDKIVFITGASGGLGSQMVRDFARAGASVVVHNYDLHDATAKLLGELDAMSAKYLLVEGDCTDQAAIDAMVERIDAAFGRIDVLVNNAGASPNKMDFTALPARVWDTVMSINLKSVFLVTQACLPLLERSQRGRVINLSSTAARNGGAVGGSAYSASKGGVSSLTKALAKDFCSRNILVNAISPGLIDTPFYGDVNVAEKYAERIKGVPLRRVGEPKDISGPVMFLASSMADYITGEVIEVSGGLPLMA